MHREDQRITWIDILLGIAIGLIAAGSLSPATLAAHVGCTMSWVLIGAMQALLLTPAWALGRGRTLSAGAAALLCLGKFLASALAVRLLCGCCPDERGPAAACLLALALAPPCACCLGRRASPALPAAVP